MSRMFISKTIALLAALVVVFISITVPTNVYAYEDMDTAKNGSASLTLQLPAASDSVKLYFVADMDTQTHITMKDEYKARVDSFYMYHDQNNCQRVYEDVINEQKLW